MSNPFVIDDPSYESRLKDAIAKAVMDASIIEHDGGKTAMVRTAELLNACLTTAAVFIANTGTASTPSGRRELAEYVRKRFLRDLMAARECEPFAQTIDIEGDAN